ncbi:GNAT family N-acetyltransferase [Clostridium sp. PL3]|uniref:GNAT family N-acetyltransferase n=1 Tax=Clostridium thailandense TaxID=2794346 RepID=A0A949X2N6_9CLOT|nr:GNAT family N-acetyltransferase [Clostridium thailandense]MBV7273484.1 GNAT family N-acetyltransferase [Clostridium thailandense]
MKLTLVPLKAENITMFKRDMQKAFQYGYEKECGPSDELILPEEDIDESLNAKSAEAYQAVINGEVFGGAVITVNNETHHNHLDFLFIKVGCQGSGVGQELWKAIENLHPETKVWETFTPYFEKRNIHFYVNKCGFHIVEFYNPLHPEPDMPETVGGMAAEEGDYFFRFEKNMNCKS